MPPVKQCPKCSSMVPIRKSVCVCGHSFKINVPVYSTRKSKRIAIAMQQQRASESAQRYLQYFKQASKDITITCTAPRV